MKHLNPVKGNDYEYTCIVGTGGIGSGIFFSLEGNHTMGRNESRAGKLLPYKDYCKIHIITHYLAVLLGAGNRGKIDVYPIGKVGDDEAGSRLINEIRTVGANTHYISSVSGCSTLFSVCFQYPDYTGGNITTSESASGQVTPQDITRFFDEFGGNGNKLLVIAAPEVPLDARIRLLEHGRELGGFNIASVLSYEAGAFMKAGGFEKTDLLFVNIDEAGSIAGLGEGQQARLVADKCIQRLLRVNRNISVVITDGPFGSYGYCDGVMEHTPVYDTDVVATAGAGDALLAGTAAGLCCGLPLLKGREDSYFSQTPLRCALELGTLLAALSVTVPDSINMTANVERLRAFAGEGGVLFSKDFETMFGNKLLEEENENLQNSRCDSTV